MKRAFAVGRCNGQTTLVLVLGVSLPAMRGPWTVQAVVSRN